MQYKQTTPSQRLAKATLLILMLTLMQNLLAQTTYLPLGHDEYAWLQRMEILMQKDSTLNFSKTKPFSRLYLAEVLQKAGAAHDHKDVWRIRMAAIKNPDHLADDSLTGTKKIFPNATHAFLVNLPHLFLSVNPLFQYTDASERGSSRHLFQNTRGLAVRGVIAKKIAFAASITDNQERLPSYVDSFVSMRKAVPGAGFFQEFKNDAYDYFDARGYISFGITNFIQAQFGSDKNFIGNGQRSLFLSDFSAPQLFLKLNTRIWKFNFQNLFMELNSANRLNADQYLPKKYAAMHHLDLALTPWLNVGLFEAVVFGRENRFEFGYLNPVIFYRSVEQQSGSADNALVGMDAKANLAKKVQLYGQFILDEFSLKERRRGSGWWGNKTGWQLGGHYVNAFGINNLDLQLEYNTVRPFTYSHGDSVANYTHYNQPLAHPLGANFRELIGSLRFMPAPRWNLDATLMLVRQGLDSGTTSFGGNIFLPNVPPYRKQDFGYTTAGGVRSHTQLAQLRLSYEWKPNLYLDAKAVWRRQNTDSRSPLHTTVIQGGLRWNLPRRNFLF